MLNAYKYYHESKDLNLIQRSHQIYRETLGVNYPNTKVAKSRLPVIKEKSKRSFWGWFR